MYNNIEEFINDGHLITDLIMYDFKNEAPWDDVVREKDPLKKFQRYKEHNRDGGHFDCDNSNGYCPLVNDIYIKLWGWCYAERYSLPGKLAQFRPPWNRMGSDTMNSFQTTYNQTLKIYGTSNANIAQNRQLHQFASLTHSIGNFTLVPFLLTESDQKSFNQYRGFNSGKYFVYDYFDLSLKLIKENTSEDVFRKYVDAFFLNDYVDEAYHIKPLFQRHEQFLKQDKLLLDNPELFLPADECELNEYLETVIRLIQSRGRRIAAALEAQGILHQKKAVKNSPPPISLKVKKIAKAAILTFAAWWILLIVLRAFEFFGSAIGTIPYLIKHFGLPTVLSETIKECLLPSISEALLATPWTILLLWIFKKLALRFANKHLRRCPSCGKWFAVERILHRKTSSKDISILVETKRKDSTGSVVGTQEQYIPGKRIAYEDTYKCKYCEKSYSKTYSVDEKSI